jgi:hypothetical protein
VLLVALELELLRQVTPQVLSRFRLSQDLAYQVLELLAKLLGAFLRVVHGDDHLYPLEIRQHC